MALRHFPRELHLPRTGGSAFLFGPRMTGKTTLLASLSPDHSVNLLDPEIELRLRGTPRFFWEELQPLQRNALVIVDEIQRVPVLLDYVQMAIDQRRHRFLLSGSSARKLRRGGVNLLGGRALDLRLHPLTVAEIGDSFVPAHALQYGTLPAITRLVLDRECDEARRYLRSYVTTYIKEEIQAEALTRNVGSFQRFLAIAAQSNGQVIEFANIARECAVPASTVKEYYAILEDTLVGEFLWPHDRSERKKARPKFYFFDCGVVQSLQNRLQDPPTAMERGVLFETWLLRELIRIRDYLDKGHEFSLWREGPHEVDILISGSRGPLLAIECKAGHVDVAPGAIEAFRRRWPKVPLYVASLTAPHPRTLSTGVEILPWQQIVEMYRQV